MTELHGVALADCEQDVRDWMSGASVDHRGRGFAYCLGRLLVEYDRRGAELARYRDALRPRTDPDLPQRRDDPDELRERLDALGDPSRIDVAAAVEVLGELRREHVDAEVRDDTMMAAGILQRAVPNLAARDRLLGHYLGKMAARLGLSDQARRVTPVAGVDEIESVGEAVLAELERLRARVAELDAGEIRTQWGIRWPDGEVRYVGTEESVCGPEAARFRDAGGRIVKRGVRETREYVGPWTEVSS